MKKLALLVLVGIVAAAGTIRAENEGVCQQEQPAVTQPAGENKPKTCTCACTCEADKAEKEPVKKAE